MTMGTQLCPDFFEARLEIGCADRECMPRLSQWDEGEVAWSRRCLSPCPFDFWPDLSERSLNENSFLCDMHTHTYRYQMGMHSLKRLDSVYHELCVLNAC